ncbi:sigma-70 family RNA polymerase sigma factor [Pseudalkalibacillus sp. Hm43]|uniref:sigma-70 family RNA polymerase sigma factor n=1 Tax=Pseudalkalibacillus sp. Hm43 TaxID=3450742 RepID=UPI003F42A7D8
MNSTEKEQQSLAEKQRELKAEFNTLIQDSKKGLWKYCRHLTGSPWDGEDLFQETVMKAFGSFYQRWHPTNPKSYLYRIATNTWIDHCRREKRFVGHLEEEDVPSEDFSDDLDMEEALRYLADRFSPRQTAVFLLMEVFSFTAKEVAGIVRTTPGAVYAAVRRMKEKLKNQPSTQGREALQNNEKNPIHPLIKTYLKALNEGDLQGVLDLISDEAHNEATLGFQEFSKDEMRSGSMQFGLPGYRAELETLWGRDVIVIYYDSETGPQIHDIQYQEVENHKIVYHKSFYFRKELLIAAAEELGCEPQMDKFPETWAD